MVDFSDLFANIDQQELNNEFPDTYIDTDTEPAPILEDHLPTPPQTPEIPSNPFKLRDNPYLQAAVHSRFAEFMWKEVDGLDAKDVLFLLGHVGECLKEAFGGVRGILDELEGDEEGMKGADSEGDKEEGEEGGEGNVQGEIRKEVEVEKEKVVEDKKDDENPWFW